MNKNNTLERIIKPIKNNSITRLNLWGDEIGDDGAIAIAEALKTNTTITYINLYDNEIGDEGKNVLEKVEKDNLDIRY